MNLQKIRMIVNAELPDNVAEQLLIEELAKDPNAISTVLLLLQEERETNKELITDMNLLLSKAHTGLEEPKINKDGFMQKEISEFYETGRIFHCFPKAKVKK